MGLNQKFLFPIAFCVLACAGAGFWILSSELAHVKRYFLTQMAEARAAEVSQKVNILSRQALEKAALFSRLPFVVEACSKALSGKPQEELDPVGQEAREELRRVLAPYIAGFFDSTGEKLRLHITLSNGHSLLRAWQDKQTLRNNVWADISDDLSATRPTLGVVAQTGKSLTGIELGRSGLDIRGIAPIRTPDGKQVGAVETQTDFNAVLDRDSQGAVNGFMFMSAEHLSVTTSLNDRSKYPLLEDKFVLLAGSPTNPSYRLISIEFLSKAKSGVQLALFDNKALAAFPIKDFQGKQLGVMVMPFDTSLVTSIISSMMTSLGSMLGVMLFVISSAVVVLLIYLVTRPVDKVVRLIKGLNNDNADMSERLDESSHDEIGRLCRWFNKLMGKITDMLCRVEGYRNVVDAIHNPIFAVDEDFKLILANKAALLAVGAPNVDAVLGKTCRETFNTDICGSDKCAIANGKRLQGFYETGLVEMKLKGVNRITRPFSDVVYDCNGKVAGYLEVINDVTDLVMKEREVASNLERISEVNNQLAEVSSRVATTSTQIAAQVEEVSKGSVRQRQLVSEAASSMLQMNSTIVEVAKNASYAAEQAAKGQGKAQEGAQVVTEAMQAISHVNDLSADLKTNLNELGVQANDIGKIMNVISDIADQTNLLALNAAIEAARAGEAGRGFAVVADEVRKLAEKTLNATQEVRQAIESIQNGSQKNLNSMEAVTGAVDKATSLSKRSGEALTEIVDLVQTTSTQVMSIATAAEEQSAASEHISRTIGEVNDISSQTADGMRHSSQAVNELSNLAQLLKRIASN